ncbi:hypothetical protein [Labedella endophytica]|uniref:Uncharacterized protein n=1 Tax=Labedella endophytica TaxID=1523160 RepID=A0A433JS69_9MICO|nr:hypothetical protein [Labedella endophytica]RUR01143.1 hypothetical protein ELQ94_06355 [Labedella endophytica]
MLGGDADYNPLAQYWWGWMAIAIAIVVLVVLWYVFVWWWSRRATESVTVPDVEAVPAPSREELRARYLGLVDEVVAAYDDGALTRRAAHRKLGSLVRLYAQEASGVRADVMTLDDLTAARLGSIAHAVAVYYPAEFASVESGDVRRSADVAKQAVVSWW